MLKYLSYTVAFQEVPNEISLIFNISNCPYHCDGCHSPELAEDAGDDLTKAFESIVAGYADAITCICFMGTGHAFTDDQMDLLELRVLIDNAHLNGYKTCVYTGDQGGAPWELFFNSKLDYLKIGPYKKELGGLDSPTTNQRFYKKTYLDSGILVKNITESFRKNYGGT